VVADSTTDAAAAAGGALLIYLIVAGLLYFLPTVVALVRKCDNTGPVVIINLFLGWTVIGWIVALAMAFGRSRSATYATQVVQVYAPGSGQAPMQQQTGISPDGRYWWDGIAWRDTDASVPPFATRSDDGQFWWDGTRWRALRNLA